MNTITKVGYFLAGGALTFVSYLWILAYESRTYTEPVIVVKSSAPVLAATTTKPNCAEKLQALREQYEERLAPPPRSVPLKKPNDTLKVMVFKVDPPICYCGYPATERYGSPRCDRAEHHCDADIHMKLRVRNSRTNYAGEMHVECIYYDTAQAHTTSYILRHQEYFKPNVGSYTIHAYIVTLPDYVMRNYVSSGSTIGVDCSVVAPDQVPVDATAMIPPKKIKEPVHAKIR